MGQLIGFAIGGLIWTYLFGRLLARLAFRESPPDTKALYGSIAAFGLVCIIAALGFGNPIAGLFYAPGALGGYFLLRKDYRKAWVGDEQTFE